MSKSWNKNKRRGLYDKFKVERRDGQSAPGKKHENCRYYVLDLDHDPFAAHALQAYADACQLDFPILARDLHDLAEDSQRKTGA